MRVTVDSLNEIMSTLCEVTGKQYRGIPNADESKLRLCVVDGSRRKPVCDQWFSEREFYSYVAGILLLYTSRPA